VEFEFDQAKSEFNKLKHGIDFVEARQLWNDPNLLEATARSVGEARWLVIGRIGPKHWSAVITYRGGRIRLISVRRSRVEEIGRYEDA
jgi:uncharacterized DUF497 family protein